MNFFYRESKSKIIFFFWGGGGGGEAFKCNLVTNMSLKYLCHWTL